MKIIIPAVFGGGDYRFFIMGTSKNYMFIIPINYNYY